jgi:hypothetical protein
VKRGDGNFGPKPTKDRVTLERIYRKQLAMEKEVRLEVEFARVHRGRFQSDVRSALAMLSERIESVLTQMYSYQGQMDRMDVRFDNLLPIVTHCERLLKEKETMRKMIYPSDEEMRVREANAYISRPMPFFHGANNECVYRTTREEMNANLHVMGGSVPTVQGPDYGDASCTCADPPQPPDPFTHEPTCPWWFNDPEKP